MKTQAAKNTLPPPMPQLLSLTLTKPKIERPKHRLVIAWTILSLMFSKALGMFKKWYAQPDLDFENWRRIEFRNEYVENSRREPFRGFRNW